MYSNIRGTIQTVVLGDFNYPKIDWTHCATTTNTNDPNFMFLETARDCFLQQYVKSPTREVEIVIIHTTLIDLLTLCK